MGNSKDPERGDEGVVEGVPAYYGTFQGQSNYPQPVPPSEGPHYASSNQTQNQNQYQYQSVTGPRQRVMEGRPLMGGEHYQREDKLPCCNLGFGWVLFILGFVIVFPWYVGTFMYFCVAHDYRERNGLLACAVASLIAIVLGVGGGRAGGVL